MLSYCNISDLLNAFDSIKFNSIYLHFWTIQRSLLTISFFCVPLWREVGQYIIMNIWILYEAKIRNFFLYKSASFSLCCWRYLRWNTCPANKWSMTTYIFISHFAVFMYSFLLVCAPRPGSMEGSELAICKRGYFCRYCSSIKTLNLEWSEKRSI